MSPAAAVTRPELGYRRDVMDLLGITEQTYKTYLEAGLIRPLFSATGRRRHIYNMRAVREKFQVP